MIKSLQKKVLILVIVCITLCLVPTNNVYAKLVTDEEVQYVIDNYCEIVKEELGK